MPLRFKVEHQYLGAATRVLGWPNVPDTTLLGRESSCFEAPKGQIRVSQGVEWLAVQSGDGSRVFRIDTRTGAVWMLQGLRWTPIAEPDWVGRHRPNLASGALL